MITVPEIYKQYSQFIIWEEQADPRGVKPKKVPIDPVTGHNLVDLHNPKKWLSFEMAFAHHLSNPKYNIGFILTEEDPFFFLDIDDALQPDGTWSELSTTLFQQFPGCYFEISQNQHGFHLLGSMSGCVDHACKNIPLGLEFYTEKRFIALTGKSCSGCASVSHDDRIKWLVDTYFNKVNSSTDVEWTNEPVPEWGGITDDEELLTAMMNSTGTVADQVMGTKLTIKDLFYFDVTQDRNNFDWSSLDQSLCNHLAFWTGKDCERMDRLFRMSTLCREDKWIIRDSYRKMTILGACGFIDNVHRETKKTDNNGDGFRLSTVDMQIDYFKNCVFDASSGKIFTPQYGCLDEKRFKAIYGGWVFQLGNHFDTKTTTNAWTAFTNSQGHDYPIVSGTCFRPDREPSKILTIEGETFVNTYTNVEVLSVQGDVSRFTDHIRWMFPRNNDANILIYWLAACVQYKGVKFRWAPVIQGVQGNGKTLISGALLKAIGRKYNHAMNAGDLGNKFNIPLENNIVITIEDVNIGGKYDTMELLKPMITQTFIEIQGKGVDQRSGETCANFILFTNHEDGLIITDNERRYAPLFAEQQDKKDLKNGAYFQKLFNWFWMKGFAHVNHYLQNLTIPDELNPATGCQRAPETTYLQRAIVKSYGHTEQAVIQAIEEGRKGFCGGWISSIALSNLIKDMKVKGTPLNKRSDMLKTLGYVHHPSLNKGRVPNPLASEGGRKPRLYVKKDSIQSQITGPRQITELYVQAQALMPLATQVFSAGSV